MKFCALIFLVFTLVPGQNSIDAAEPVKAFPEAEGFGAYAKGGRGGKVLFVTNLNDSGPGSFREAVESEGPRTILFRVSGTIELESSLKIRNPYVTIAGQSAPGQGICLKNQTFSVSTHDVIIRYLRSRPGDEPGPEFRKKGKGFSPDALSISSPSQDVIFDHCSAGWAIDECLSVSGKGINNVTVQWCMITESLNSSFHEKGSHGYGSLLRTNGNVTFHHNLYAYHKSRSPRPGTYGEGSILLDFRNNVIVKSFGYSAKDPVRMNYIGNYIKQPRKAAFSIGGETTRMYASNNIVEIDGVTHSEDWFSVLNLKPVNKMKEPFPVAEVQTDSPQAAYDQVLSHSGAILPERDQVDLRVINQVREGEGDLINSQKDVGGWPLLKSAEPLEDSDQDGMPDAWEKENHLSPKEMDYNGDPDKDGYTNMEEYLNDTNPNQKN